MTRQSLQRWLPFLGWPRLTRELARGEMLAGLTVALLAVPQAVAYAALAGMPVVTGIYASFLPSLVAALFSASPRVSVGPTALSCLLVNASLAGLAAPGSPEWVGLAIWLALLSGLIQVALGVGGFGWVVQLVSAPVLMAFTQAATVLIILSQLPALLGLPPGLGVLRGGGVAWGAAAFGLAGLAVLLLGKRLRPEFPAVLVVVVASAALSWALGYGAHGGAVVGALPDGLPALVLPPAIDWSTLGQLVVPALVITLVSFLETASSAKNENRLLRRPWNENQDLIAQGLAKLSAAVTGAFPTSSSFSRSALYIYAGALSGWASVFTVVLVFLVLLFLVPALAHIPKAILSAVVIAAVSGLIRPRQFVHLWRTERVECVIAGITAAITLLTAPTIYWGVLAGVLLGLSYFLYQRLHPRIIEVGLHPDGSLRDRHLWHLPPLAPALYALRMDAELDFAAAATLERNITEYLSAHPDVRHVCLFAQPINRIDATGAETFGQMRHNLTNRQVVLHISGIKLPVEKVLRRAGELPESPWLRMYRTDAEALQALQAPQALVSPAADLSPPAKTLPEGAP